MSKKWPLLLCLPVLGVIVFGLAIGLRRTPEPVRQAGHPTKLGNERTAGEETSKGGNAVTKTDPERVPSPTSFDSSDLIARFRSGKTWQERDQTLSSIPLDQVAGIQGFLFEVGEGGDVDAVRSTALKLLEKAAERSASSSWLVNRFCARLPLEPRASLRYQLLNALGHLYLAHPDENDFCFDYILERLKNDEAGNVRANAAGVVGYFAYHDKERALSTLRRALEEEKDPEVRAAIQRRIGQIE